MTAEHRISVRDLVSHVLATGDLEYGFTGSGRLLRALRAHQKIQQQRPTLYQPEVSVSHTIDSSDIKLIVGGRIDGLWPLDDGRIRVEEIKTTSRSISTVSSMENPLHWGQLKCYAYMIAHDNNLSTIEGQLTYYHLETGRTVETLKIFDLEALTVFFDDLVSSYLGWVKTVTEWQRHRNTSILQTAFPFPQYRPGQRQMAITAFRTIRDKGRLMAQAATGIGKTMAVLFPAIKALREDLTDTIFYLTARTTGRMAAEQTLNQCRGKGLVIKSLVITAKEKICFEPDAACNPEACSFAKGFYDRCRSGIEEAFERDALTRERLEDIARRHMICPFALSLMLAGFVDVVICDYNYVFDPRVSLKTLLDERKSRHTFLVDEAHNLVDRSREMFSASLTKQPFLTVRRMLKNDLPELHRLMGRINRWFLNIRKAGNPDATPRTDRCAPDGLMPLLWRFIHRADQWLAKNKKAAYSDALLELYFSTTNFLRVCEAYDDRYVTCYEPEDNDFRVTLFCVDPSPQVAERLKKSRATIFFSATLTPMNFFIDILGSGAKTQRLIIPSPFPPQNRCVIVCPHISTRYRLREKTRPAVLSAIQTTLETRPGNYLFFFPSHQYLQAVHTDFEETGFDADVKMQTSHMAEHERERFIAHFTEENTRSRIAFAVMGGIFGEGIDLTGDRLNGVAIIGVGLPAISWQNELIRDYFQQKTGEGYEYAYVYPGINRVLQAAGRVIRSEKDVGVILLIDDRFNTALYRKLLPSDWQLAKALNSKDIQKHLLNFRLATQ